MAAGTSGAAAAMAAIAAAQAREAKVIACKAFMPGYQHDAATDAQMRQYASCVQLVYPEALGQEATVLIKGCIVLLIAGFVIGGVCGYRNRYGGWLGDTVMGALGGLLVVGCSGLAIAALVLGIKFLVS